MKQRPNILLVLTDQQHHRMLSCAGNDYVRTPNLDRLAAEGTRFTRAYCANPVCVPSRFSLFTGRMPSHIGMRHNDSEGVRSLNPEEQRQGMGHLLREAGYLPVYDEAVRIPFLMRHPGRIAAGRIDPTHLINNGLDLLPTLCDYADVEVPPGLNGASIRPRAEFPEQATPQRHVFAENQVSDMLCTGDWKYVEYFGGENPVQLYDLTRDPGETRNAAFDPGNEPVLTYHRALLARERRKHGSSTDGSGSLRVESP